MSSIFEIVTRNVVHELNRKGDLIPLDSLIDSDRFHCCSLLCKRKCFLPFFKPRYLKTGLTVDDLLEASDELDCVSTEVKEKKNYRIEDNVEMKMNITLNVPQVTSVNGKAEFSTACNLKLKSCEISLKGKESLLKEEQPSLFEALKKAGENLYMVIETVELAEEQKVERKYFTDTLFEFLMGKIKGHMNVNSGVTIPSESVLAFRINLLVFDERCCRISYSNDENSFPLESGSASRSGGQTEEPSQLLENFSDLQENVKDMNWELQDLTETERKDVLAALISHLRDGALGEVEEKVNMTLLTEELSDPEVPLLSILFNDCGSFMPKRADAILYFLEALTELKELQQKLLAVAVEEGHLSELMKLVKDILLQTSKSGPASFSLKADSVTHTLVRMCDTEYKLDHSVTWNSETCHSLCALYVALSVLLLLAQGPSSVL